MNYKLVKFTAIIFSGVLSSACTTVAADPSQYIVIKPYGNTSPVPTVIMAHGCDGFTYDRGQGYKNRANLIANRYNYNVVLYDAFTPRGWVKDEVCTGERGAGANPVPPVRRVEDTKKIAKWVYQQSWHTGKISFIGYSHGGSVGLAIANDREAAKLISSVVSYYPNCDSQYIGSRIDQPHIPTLVHLGDADNWTPMWACLNHNGVKNYTMHVYKNATHAWESGANTVAIGKWPIRYNMDAAQLAEDRTKIFFDINLK